MICNNKYWRTWSCIIIKSNDKCYKNGAHVGTQLIGRRIHTPEGTVNISRSAPLWNPEVYVIQSQHQQRSESKVRYCYRLGLTVYRDSFDANDNFVNKLPWQRMRFGFNEHAPTFTLTFFFISNLFSCVCLFSFNFALWLITLTSK